MMKHVVGALLLGLALGVNCNTANARHLVVEVHVFPGGCPRCEIAIPSIFALAKRVDSTSETIVIFEGRSSAASSYSGRNNFRGAEKLVADSVGDFSALLARNGNVPVLKIFDENGVLLERSLLGIASIGDSTTDVFKALHGELPIRVAQLRRIGLVKLMEDTGQAIGPPIAFVMHPTKPIMFLLDPAQLYVRAYDTHTGRQVSTYRPPLELRRRYSPNLDDSSFSTVERQGVARSMLFSPDVLSSGDTIVMQGSLPVITRSVDTSAGSYTIAAANPTVRYSLSGQYLDSHITALPSDQGLLYSLVQAHFDPYRHQYIFGVEKVKPLTSQTVPVLKDPGLDTFYSSAPLVAIYDSTFKAVKTAGRLGAVYQTLRIGYNNCFVSVVALPGRQLLLHTLSDTIYDALTGDHFALQPPKKNVKLESLSRPNGFEWTAEEVVSKVMPAIECGIWTASPTRDQGIDVIWHIAPSGAALAEWEPVIQRYEFVGVGSSNKQHLKLVFQANVPVQPGEVVRGIVCRPLSNEIVVLKAAGLKGYIFETYEIAD